MQRGLRDRLAELGHLLKPRLVLRACVLEELRVDPEEILRGSAFRKLLGHRKVFLQTPVDERSPLAVGSGDTAMADRVGRCICIMASTPNGIVQLPASVSVFSGMSDPP